MRVQSVLNGPEIQKLLRARLSEGGWRPGEASVQLIRADGQSTESVVAAMAFKPRERDLIAVASVDTTL